jgi:hypothetical protein
MIVFASIKRQTAVRRSLQKVDGGCQTDGILSNGTEIATGRNWNISEGGFGCGPIPRSFSYASAAFGFAADWTLTDGRKRQETEKRL